MVSASLLLELGQVESAQQCLGRAIFLQPDQAGLRIQIRHIRRVSGSGSGSRRAKMTNKRIFFLSSFFESVGWPLLRAEGFFCNLEVRDRKIVVFDPKNI
jgi:hypothetical protein